MAVILEIVQAGSGSNAIHLAPGDTLRFVLAGTQDNVVYRSQVASTVARMAPLQALGINVSFDDSGSGS